MTPSPADLQRLPQDAIGGARRVVAEIVLVRNALTEGSD